MLFVFIIIGLPDLPEFITQQISPIHPLPPPLHLLVRETNPGYGENAADEIQLFLSRYDHQVRSSFFTVLSAVFPGLSLSFTREIVALAFEGFPSLAARFI